MSVPYTSYRARQEIIESPFDVLDVSWELELPMRLADGELAGRDFMFTYGPLYQVVHAFGLIVPPGNLASVMRFYSLPEAFLTLLGAWLILRLTKAPLAWRAAAYLAWAFFFSPTNTPPHYYSMLVGLKPLAGLFVLCACGYALAGGSVGDGRSFLEMRATLLLWALAVPLLILYSFDMAVMCGLSLTLMGAVVFVVKPGLRRDTLYAMLSAIAGFVLFAVTLSLSNWSRYLPDSWRLAQSYSQGLVVALSLYGSFLTASAIISGCLLLIFALRQLRRADELNQRRALVLIAAASYSLMWTRYGLSRSDGEHVLRAIAPMLFTVGCLLPCYLRGTRTQGARLWLACLIPLMLLSPFGWPYTVLVGTKHHAGVVYRVAGIRKTELRPAFLDVSNKLMNQAMPPARASSAEALYVWPYQTLVTLLVGKRNPAYTMQSYAAANAQSEHETVARLQTETELPAFLFRRSAAIDRVEGLTRTPIIFRYLLEHYQLSEPHPAFIILQRRTQPLRWLEQPLAVARQGFAPGDARTLIVNLPDQSDMARASDLLVIRLRATKTHTFGIGKPGATYLTFHLSNGERRIQSIILPTDGETHDILVSASTLADDPLFISIFDDRIWRSPKSLTAVELNWDSLDLLTVKPDEIVLEGISVLRRVGAQTFETSVEEQAEADRHELSSS